MKALRCLLFFAALFIGSLSHADTSAIAPVGKKLTIEITNIAKPVPGRSYRWYKDGVATKVTAPWYIVEHVTAKDSGTYKVVIYDPRGNMVSDNATVVVK